MNKPDIMDMPAPPAAQQNATQIEFNQAMEDFKTMFPSMDLEVIEVLACLRDIF